MLEYWKSKELLKDVTIDDINLYKEKYIDTFINENLDLYKIEEFSVMLNRTDEEIKNMIMSLRYVTKTRLLSFEFCEMSYFFSDILGISYPVSDNILFGSYIHRIMDLLYDYLDYTKLLSDPFNIIFQTLCELARENIYFFPNFKEMLINISNYEASRLKLIIDFCMNNNLNPIKYFKPLFKEVMITNEKLRMRGRIDNISLNGDNTLIIIDYKSGKVKKDDKYLLANANKELGFYKCIVEDKDSVGFGCEFDRNVSFCQLLYLRDLYNSPLLKTSEIDTSGLMFDVLNYFDKVYHNNFKPRKFRNKEYCLRMCNFYNICSRVNSDFDYIKNNDLKIFGKVLETKII